MSNFQWAQPPSGRNLEERSVIGQERIVNGEKTTINGYHSTPIYQNLSYPSSSRQQHYHVTPPPVLSPPVRSPIPRSSPAGQCIDFNTTQGSLTEIIPPQTRGPPRPQRPDSGTRHKRTKTGCFTCRKRRIKCSEQKPVCIQCQRGNRECDYKLAAESAVKQEVAGPQQSPHPSSDGEYSEDHDNNSMYSSGSPMRQENDGRRGSPLIDVSPQIVNRQLSQSPGKQSRRDSSRVTPNALSPLREIDAPISLSARSRHDWSHLTEEERGYLDYFLNDVTYHHYSWKIDTENYLHTKFFETALRYEPLLHAVITFAILLQTVEDGTDLRLQRFLESKNRALNKLADAYKESILRRPSFEKQQAFLLACLQMATIAEFTGDYKGMLTHQNHVCEKIRKMYTPHTIVQTHESRILLGWYCRFDVYAGLVGSVEARLDREWLVAPQEYFARRVSDEPDNIRWKIEEAISSLRLIALDLSVLSGKVGKMEITIEQFVADNEGVAARIRSWKDNMNAALQDDTFLVKEFSRMSTPTAEDIINPYEPDVLWNRDLWPMNFVWMDWYSVDLMHRLQTAKVLQEAPRGDPSVPAYAACKIFEAIARWPRSPKGSIVGSQASLGLSCIFLPRDERHHVWSRQRFALVERQGYIYPPKFRKQMADFYDDQSVLEWWLPHYEHCPPIVKALIKASENTDEDLDPYRLDAVEDSVSRMIGVFGGLNLKRSPIPSSAEPSPPEQFSYAYTNSPTASMSPGVDEGLGWGTRRNNQQNNPWQGAIFESP